MPSIFDLITPHYEPDILDHELRMLVWRANCSGFLASDLPKRSTKQEPDPQNDQPQLRQNRSST